MELSVVTKLPSRKTNGCIIAAVYSDDSMPAETQSLDKQSNGALRAIVKQSDLGKKLGDQVILHNLEGISCNRVMLVRAGDESGLEPDKFAKLCAASVAAVRKTGSPTVFSHLPSLVVTERDISWRCQHEALAARNSDYRFTGHDSAKSRKKSTSSTLEKWQHVVDSSKTKKTAAIGSSYGNGISVGCDLARDLGNLAPNICTPTYLATQAKSLQKLSKKLKVSVLDEVQMKKLGMGALLSVSRGSRQPAKLICMEYNGGKRGEKPAVLLGKGITFDTGGISIKPSATMDEMKYDMCGAASVMGAMRACLELELKCNVTCVVAAAENMPDGDASRPGDVITSMSGQTIEILNTDAEGRLVLCDALTWIERLKPAAVIDVATLTGACIVALGHQTSALMANDQSLADSISHASQTALDKTWQLPIWKEYQSQLDSNFADMANIGGRAAGSITAGCFLSRFAEKFRWAHLDIAGIAWHSGKNKGATGRPVPLLVQYLIDNHV